MKYDDIGDINTAISGIQSTLVYKKLILTNNANNASGIHIISIIVVKCNICKAL